MDLHNIPDTVLDIDVIKRNKPQPCLQKNLI